jgi:hypothetical protein
MSAYQVVEALPHRHTKGAVGHEGKCSLHGCGETAIARPRTRRRGSVAGGVRCGVDEYRLQIEPLPPAHPTAP